LRTAALACVLALQACGEATGPEREISGEQIYNQYCARCHGSDGYPVPEMKQARVLADRRVIDAMTDEAIKMAIQRGKGEQMPAFGDVFTEASLLVLVAYVRSLSGSQGKHAPEPEGGAAP
jgi:mono/diheme cytochrome c family protein